MLDKSEHAGARARALAASKTAVAVEGIPPAAVRVGFGALEGAMRALDAAFEQRPTTRQLWHTSMVLFAKRLSGMESGSAEWFHARDLFYANLVRVVADLFTDPAIRAWFREGTPQLPNFLMHHMLLISLQRPDLAAFYDVELRQWVPEQKTEVSFDPNGVPVVGWGGPPAERKKLEPLLDYMALSVGGAADEYGDTEQQLRERGDEALKSTWERFGRVTIKRLAQVAHYERTYFTKRLDEYGIDKQALKLWRPGKPSPFFPSRGA